MKFWEALKAIEEGKKVRLKKWNPEAYVKKLGEKSLYFHKGDHRFFNLYSSDDFFEEWELYEEPDKMLSFMEVVCGLKERKRYKRKSWGEECWLCLEDGYMPFEYVIGGSFYHTNLKIEDFEAMDWVEVDG